MNLAHLAADILLAPYGKSHEDLPNEPDDVTPDPTYTGEYELFNTATGKWRSTRSSPQNKPASSTRNSGPSTMTGAGCRSARWPSHGKDGIQLGTPRDRKRIRRAALSVSWRMGWGHVLLLRPQWARLREIPNHRGLTRDLRATLLW